MKRRKGAVWAMVISATLITAGSILGCGDDDSTTGTVIGDLVFKPYQITGSGTVEVSCPSDELAVGGGCACVGGYLWISGTVNAGSLQGQGCACEPPGTDTATVHCVYAVSETVLQPAVQEQKPGALLNYLQNLEE